MSIILIMIVHVRGMQAYCNRYFEIAKGWYAYLLHYTIQCQCIIQPSSSASHNPVPVHHTIQFKCITQSSASHNPGSFTIIIQILWPMAKQKIYCSYFHDSLDSCNIIKNASDINDIVMHCAHIISLQYAKRMCMIELRVIILGTAT